MFCQVIVTLISVHYVFSTSNANYFCADMKPQSTVDIEQLMGMWYGIEVISHKQDEEHMIEYFDTCPVIHLSEIRTPSTITPLHSDFNYGYNYGSGYGIGSGYHQQPPQQQPSDTYQSRDNTNYQQRPSSSVYGHSSSGSGTYGTVGTNREQGGYYGYGNYGSNRDGYNSRRRQQETLRRLRLLWDEGGDNVEYLLKLNETRPGFWISSGPQNGSNLEEQYNKFAGTIQVIKAVGNHLVLTFCHQLPDRQLFSILLSREPRLLRQEINSVHNLLNRRELSTNHIRKVCSNDASSSFSAFQNVSFLLHVVSSFYLLFFIRV